MEREYDSVSSYHDISLVEYRFVSEYTKAIAPHVKIIASAGSAEKVKVMKSAGVDVAFNYKEQDTFEVLKEHGPIDVYVSACSFLWI